MTPTQRTVKYLRDEGYWCQVVEKWNPFARIRQDLIGCDVLALKAGEPPLLVQTTSFPNMRARINKLHALEPASLWLRCGGRIVVHGWKKKPTALVEREVGFDREG